MVIKRKKGENEAIKILQSIGVEIDLKYYDDNGQDSMPDLKYIDGRGIEVTHTYHNDEYFIHLNKYNQRLLDDDPAKSLQRMAKIEKECSSALDRVNHGKYDKYPDGMYTEESKKLYKKDLKLLKNHMGYDPTQMDFRKKFTEFKCDMPTFHFSVDNILQEVVNDKGSRHSSGDTDLFLFADKEEYRLMKELIPQVNWNGTAYGFLARLFYAPFPVIYICCWDLHKQKYNTTNPKMVKFYMENDTMKWQWFNEDDNDIE